MWNQELNSIDGLTTSQTVTAGGRGWFGTVQVGCDYQFASDWVIGAFGDWDFGSLKGNPELPGSFGSFEFGHEKQSWAWGVGARLGYVVLPQLLAFVSGGYTQAHFNNFDLLFVSDGTPAGEY